MNYKAFIISLLLLLSSMPNFVPDLEPSFTVRELSDETFARIDGISWKTGCPVTRDDLRLLTVTYVSFDDRIRKGELLCHRLVADELAEIFAELYAMDYPIEQIRLIDDYGADDRASMTANNTSMFNYRVVSGTRNLSKHAYGLAIDINPVQNPYCEPAQNYVSPANGREYADRGTVRPGMIIKGDPVYQAFVSRGWFWGGDWITQKDYQHFQKTIPGI